jgi:biopolymer transport protein ExbD
MIVAGALVACAAKTPPLETQSVSIVCGETGLTGIRVGDHLVRDPASPAGESELKRLLPDKNKEIHLTGGMETPYRCVGGLIYMLQRLGYGRIGFISEPPPARTAEIPTGS